MTGIRRALPPVLLVAAALAFAVAIERSLACPIYIPPQPLRTLYKLSERVVVARVGAKEVLSTNDEVASVRITLHVTENLKGTPAEVLHFYHTEFVGYQAEEARKEEEKEEEKEEVVSLSSGRRITRLKRGERYLFFLDPREKGDGYEVDDEGYAIKRLSDEDLKIYLERIKELAEIMRREPEDKLAVVEWLVRCAEQPATRWEGAYELLGSTEAAARVDDKEVAPAAESPAEASVKPQGEASVKQPAAEEPRALLLSSLPFLGDAQAAPEQQAAAAPPAPDSSVEEVQVLPRRSLANPREMPYDPALAPLLNAVQKQRLSDAFFATPDPVDGDDELMQLVKDFDDPRLPGFILARLHRVEDAAPLEAELWLRTLAASLKNEQLIELADTYTQEAPYFEEEEEETPEAETQTDASAEEGDAADEGEAEAEEAEEVEETPEDPAVEAARIEAATQRATRTRSAMLKTLLSRIDLFVSTGQLAEGRP
ncbi:MAG: hypothetical protein ABW208_08370 [Pyrinomonadaceae bacterium]